MKTIVLIAAMAFLAATRPTYAQDIPQNQVPSLVLNNFQQSFKKALDIEWELDGEKYSVAFEIGIPGSDHEIWYDPTGKLLRHKKEISKNDLPKTVLEKLKSEYKSYRVDDVKKISEGGLDTYTLEVKTLTEEWKLTIDSQGNVTNKMAD